LTPLLAVTGLCSFGGRKTDPFYTAAQMRRRLIETVNQENSSSVPVLIYCHDETAEERQQRRKSQRPMVALVRVPVPAVRDDTDILDVAMTETKSGAEAPQRSERRVI
jgi:hypothetical protein